MFTGLAPLGLSLIPVKETERVSGKVSNERFVNSCLANSSSVYIHVYTVIRTLKLLLRLTSVVKSTRTTELILGGPIHKLYKNT